MDDDEEIQSHASTASRSPSPYQSQSPSPSPSQSPPRRLPAPAPATAAAAQQPGSITSVALALPWQQAKASSNGGGGREDCWSEGATGVLIEAWGERYVELSRGNLKQKHWKEVADIVSSREGYSKVPKTDVQCKNRIDTVKKKFKQEKVKIVASGGCVVSTWPFYERLDSLIGSTVKIPAINTPSPAVATSNFTFPTGKIPVRSRSKTARSGDGRIVKWRKRGSKSDDSTEEEEQEEEGDWETDDSLPPDKKPRVVERRYGKRGGGGGRGGRGSSIRMLTQAIVKLGEVYEQAENAKLLQVVEMEKSRMKFAKELELQRMQFFVKTQMEISQFRHAGGGGGRISSGGGSGGRNRHNTNNNVDVVDNELHGAGGCCDDMDWCSLSMAMASFLCSNSEFACAAYAIIR